MNHPPSLLSRVRELLGSAIRTYAGTPGEAHLRAALDRLDEPLRVAIAGKVKAGKSTLLNALVGEELAPTGAGECTKIVTWYRDGTTYRVTLHLRGGTSRPVPFTHDGGAIDVTLGPTPASEVDRLVVEWPSSSLRAMTLIDTPGIASLSADVSQRTVTFLAPGEDQVTPADAVIYLMRHLHATDIRLLEAFHDEEVSHATPVNAIGVLSRADEVSVGRLDAMASAARIAERYRHDPKVRRLCQTVLPVAGLLAQSGSTLREAEFEALATLARAPRADVDPLLVSADRFVQTATPVALTSVEREHLLDRLGLFGVRLSIGMVREGTCVNASQLATELVRHSGVQELRQSLTVQFAARRDILKGRSALIALETVLRELPVPGAGDLAAEAERLTAGAHELAELRLLNALRNGTMKVRADEAETMERLLGMWGTSPAARLGLPSEAEPEDVRRALVDTIDRWQRRAENPLSSRDVAGAARVAVRTCEGLLSAPS